MFAFLMVFRRLGRAVRRGFGDPVFRGLLYMTLGLIVSGAFFYHRAEDWTFFQSVYFSVITLTTVGYGDFSPQTFAGRLFTIIYVLVGIGILIALVTQVAHHAAGDRAERREGPLEEPEPG